MKTDRELLELAAKAAGLQHQYNDFWDGFYILIQNKVKGEHWDANSRWNPLTEDGDAFRLAVKLHMALTFTVHGDTHAEGTRDEYAFQEGPNAFANARRAIVRAAAEIALAAKETT